MVEEHTVNLIEATVVANLRATCDRRGCPATGGATTPVAAGETPAAALARCRAILAHRWRLTPGLTLCAQCAHRPGHDQPALFAAEVCRA